MDVRQEAKGILGLENYKRYRSLVCEYPTVSDFVCVG